MNNQAVVQHVYNGGRLEKPREMSDGLWNILIHCWNENPTDRPKFSVLVKSIKELFNVQTTVVIQKQLPENIYFTAYQKVDIYNT